MSVTASNNIEQLQAHPEAYQELMAILDKGLAHITDEQEQQTIRDELIDHLAHHTFESPDLVRFIGKYTLRTLVYPAFWLDLVEFVDKCNRSVEEEGYGIPFMDQRLVSEVLSQSPDPALQGQAPPGTTEDDAEDTATDTSPASPSASPTPPGRPAKPKEAADGIERVDLEGVSSAERNERILADRDIKKENGKPQYTLAQLAQRYGMSVAGISYICREKATDPSQQRRHALWDEVWQARRTGQSYNEIASEFNLSLGGVRYICRNMPDPSDTPDPSDSSDTSDTSDPSDTSD